MFGIHQQARHVGYDEEKGETGYPPEFNVFKLAHFSFPWVLSCVSKSREYDEEESGRRDYDVGGIMIRVFAEDMRKNRRRNAGKHHHHSS